jgi:hypothetical protein
MRSTRCFYPFVMILLFGQCHEAKPRVVKRSLRRGVERCGTFEPFFWSSRSPGSSSLIKTEARNVHGIKWHLGS